MAIQVLIVHGQLSFAIKLKQMLERTAGFETHPFTSVDAAVDYLQDHVQDIALVDFSMAEESGEYIVRELRLVQPHIPIIATPQLNDAQMEALDVLASMPSGFSTHDLIDAINDYFAAHDRLTAANPPRPSSAPAAEPPVDLPETYMLSSSAVYEPPVREGDTPAGIVDELLWAEDVQKPESTFDDVLNSIQPDSPDGPDAQPRSPFTDLVNSMRADDVPRPLLSRQQQFVEYIITPGSEPAAEEPEEPEVPPKSVPSLFDRLAQEEPPPPSFEESGTVSDLVTGVHDRSFRNVLSILRGEDAPLEGEEGAESEASSPLKIDPVEHLPGLMDTDSGPTPAKVILQRTLEQSMSGGTFSLEELLANIEAQLPLHRPRVQPLPSWVREEQESQGDRFLIQEPDFLPEQLPVDPTPIEPSEDLYRNQTTQAARGQVIEQHPEALETEWLEGRGRLMGETLSFPESLPEEMPAEPTLVHQPDVVESLPEEIPSEPTLVHLYYAPDEVESLPEAVPAEPTMLHEYPPDLPEEAPVDAGFTLSHEMVAADESTSGWYHLPDDDFNTQFEMMAAFEVHDKDGVKSGALYSEVPVDPVPAAAPAAAASAPQAGDADDPRAAQLALSLTQASLELTAEAVLLARNKVLVAYSGPMPEDEVHELRAIIADDWDAAPGESRIRFITSPASGKDYMLYSKRTEDDLTLSLVFAGTTPLRDIRRQGQRLIEALNTVPEAPAPQATTQAAPPPPPKRTEPVEAIARTPYACVWLLRDPHAHLDGTAAQAITTGLNLQMSEQQWIIHTLQVHEDYVYLLADVPGDAPAYQIVRDLKRRSADIVHAQNPAYAADGLWADGYLVVTPGRELDVEEIQQFINFERMG